MQLKQVSLPTVDDMEQSQAFVIKEPSVEKKFMTDGVSEYQYGIVQQADKALRDGGKVSGK